MPSPRAQQWPSPPRRALRRTHPLGGERPGSLLASTPGARVVHASLFKAGSKRDSRCIPPASRASARESMPNLAELTWRSLDARARHPAQVDRLDSPRAIPAGRRRPGPCLGITLPFARRTAPPGQPSPSLEYPHEKSPTALWEPCSSLSDDPPLYAGESQALRPKAV